MFFPKKVEKDIGHLFLDKTWAYTCRNYFLNLFNASKMTKHIVQIASPILVKYISKHIYKKISKFFFDYISCLIGNGLDLAPYYCKCISQGIVGILKV